MKMRKMILAVLILSVTTASAQKISANKVPTVVSRAVSQKFPDAKAFKWEREKANFEANFKDGLKNRSVLVTPSGKIMEVETAIATSALPANVREYVSNNYKNAKIKEAAEIILASGELNYEAEVNGMDLLFSSKGIFLKAVED